MCALPVMARGKGRKLTNNNGRKVTKGLMIGAREVDEAFNWCEIVAKLSKTKTLKAKGATGSKNGCISSGGHILAQSSGVNGPPMS